MVILLDKPKIRQSYKIISSEGILDFRKPDVYLSYLMKTSLTFDGAVLIMADAFW